MFKFLNIFRRKKKLLQPHNMLLWDKEDVATLQALAYTKVKDYRNEDVQKEKTEEEMRHIRWRMIENNGL